MIKAIKDALQGKAKLSQRRNPKWAKVRREHLNAHPTCSVCGGKSKLEVHHIVPFHVNPKLELDSDNLITLCESANGGVICHLLFGHLGDYRKINPSVAMDAYYWFLKLRS